MRRTNKQTFSKKLKSVNNCSMGHKNSKIEENKLIIWQVGSVALDKQLKYEICQHSSVATTSSRYTSWYIGAVFEDFWWRLFVHRKINPLFGRCPFYWLSLANDVSGMSVSPTIRFNKTQSTVIWKKKIKNWDIINIDYPDILLIDNCH